MKLNYLLLSICLLFQMCTEPPKEKEVYVSSLAFAEGTTTDEKARLSAHVTPSQRQLNWQKMEFTCFLSYGINTYTDKEWGTGKEDPALFNPTQLDAEQWVVTAKKAGMKLMLLTCKHHDGFCLWPSKYTKFTVAASPWKGGKGDVVGDLAAACKKHDMKLGVYLSPWDMNHPDYGTEQYNDFFVDQLTELLTQYGPVAEVWFDGACGEGPNGKKQVYDFQRYFETIRKLQPEATIAIMGPDVRWVGTESGYGRDTEWSVIPAIASNLDQIAKSSQQEAGSGSFVPSGDMTQQDLGSRALLADAKGVIWYPAEVDVSIRPGWYNHPKEDTLVKSPQKLIDIFYSSIGKNSLLLLNLPPDKRGVIHENDIHNLKEMKRILDQTFAVNLVNDILKSTASRKEIENLVDDQLETYWSGSQNNNTIEFTFSEKKTIDRLLLQENITEGQRIEEFVLEYWNGEIWAQITQGTTVGYKRILRFEPTVAEIIRLRITKYRDTPQLATIGFYKASVEEQLK